MDNTIFLDYDINYNIKCPRPRYYEISKTIYIFDRFNKNDILPHN